MPPSLITIAEARRRVLEATRPLGHELIAVTDALGRVLAEDLRAAGDTPPFPCSAMDGYAVKSGPGGRTLRLVKMKDSPPMHNSIVAYRRLDAGKPEGIVAAFLGLLTTIE